MWICYSFRNSHSFWTWTPTWSVAVGCVCLCVWRGLHLLWQKFLKRESSRVIFNDHASHLTNEAHGSWWGKWLILGHWISNFQGHEPTPSCSLSNPLSAPLSFNHKHVEPMLNTTHNEARYMPLPHAILMTISLRQPCKSTWYYPIFQMRKPRKAPERLSHIFKDS